MQHIVDTALPLLLKAFDTDDDKEAVTAAVLGCGVILTGAGPHSCQKHLEAMATGSSMVHQMAVKSDFMCCAVLCCAVLCCAVLCCAVSCRCIILGMADAQHNHHLFV